MKLLYFPPGLHSACLNQLAFLLLFLNPLFLRILNNLLILPGHFPNMQRPMYLTSCNFHFIFLQFLLMLNLTIPNIFLFIYFILFNIHKYTFCLKYIHIYYTLFSWFVSNILFFIIGMLDSNSFEVRIFERVYYFWR